MKYRLTIFLCLIGMTAIYGQNTKDCIDQNNLPGLYELLTEGDSNWFFKIDEYQGVKEMDALSYALAKHNKEAAELVCKIIEDREMPLAVFGDLEKVILSQALYVSVELKDKDWTVKLTEQYADPFAKVFDCECTPIEHAISKIKNDAFAIMLDSEKDIQALELVPNTTWIRLAEAAIKAQNQEALAFIFLYLNRDFYLIMHNEDYFSSSSRKYVKSKPLTNILAQVGKDIIQNIDVREDSIYNQITEKENDQLFKALAKYGTLHLNSFYLDLPGVYDDLCAHSELISFGDMYDIKERQGNAMITIQDLRPNKLKATLKTYILVEQISFSDSEIISELTQLRNAFNKNKELDYARVCDELLLEMF